MGGEIGNNCVLREFCINVKIVNNYKIFFVVFFVFLVEDLKDVEMIVDEKCKETFFIFSGVSENVAFKYLSNRVFMGF